MPPIDPRQYITLHAAHRYKEARYGARPCDKLPLHEVDALQEEMLTEGLLLRLQAGAARHYEFGCTFILVDQKVVTVIDGKRRTKPRRRKRKSYSEQRRHG